MDRSTRIGPAILWIALALVGGGVLRTTPAHAELRKFDIRSGPAFQALREFSHQGGLDVFYDADAIKRTADAGGLRRARAIRRSAEDVGEFGSGLQDHQVWRGLDQSGKRPQRIHYGSARLVRVFTEFNDVDPRKRRARLAKQPCGETVCINANKTSDPLPLPAGATRKQFSAEYLANLGVSSVAEWARTLPQNQGSGATEDTHNYLREAGTNTAWGSG